MERAPVDEAAVRRVGLERGVDHHPEGIGRSRQRQNPRVRTLQVLQRNSRLERGSGDESVEKIKQRQPHPPPDAWTVAARDGDGLVP